MTTTAVPTKESPKKFAPMGLTLSDRCDKCGSEALARIIMPTVDTSVDLMSYDLIFCGHHTKEYETALVASGGEVLWKEYAKEENRAKGSVH